MNNKKKTQEEYISELAIKNPTVEVVGEYINNKTKITHHCLIHNIYWDMAPSPALRGDGCEICHKKRIGKSNGKSNEQYINELKENNPKIIALDKYVNTKTKIMFKCTEHNIEWKAYPNNILRGCGCAECGKEKIVNKNCKTHDQFIKELNNINSNIVVLGNYINARTPILVKCIKHNVEWETSPDSLLQGCGCHKCGNEKVSERLKWNSEKYSEKLKLKNPNIVALETYIDANTPILHKCLIDGYEWKVSPGNVIYGIGCPKCAGNNKKSQQEYVSEASIINPNIEVIGEYQNINTPIKHLCKIHNIIWDAYPCSILKGYGCIECKKEKMSIANKHTHEQYITQVQKINPNIKVIDKYIDSHTHILHQCIIDGYKWNVTPTNILSGHGCPKCNESLGERKICEYIDRHDIKYVRQKKFINCKDIKYLPFDCYLPEYNICIEYDGRQHFEPIEYFGGVEAFNRTVKHDKIKNKYCENNGISLLRIPYYKNVEEELNNFLFI